MPLSCWKCGAPSFVPHADAQPTALDSTQGSGVDLRRLLTTNEPPIDSEVFSIQAILSPLQDEADELDTQIAELHAVLHRLADRRTQLVRSIRQHRATLSAVRRVPPELLCEVFALTVSGNEALPKPPWYLGHVCQSWRRTALAYPPIWSSITIPNSSTAVSRKPALRVETLLHRSAGAPLKIYWTAITGTSVEDHSAAAVVSHCHRWSALHLQIPCPYAKFAWLKLASGCLASLRTLQIVHDYPIEFPEQFSFHGSALREVVLSGFLPITMTMIPWEQITHYRGAYPSNMHLQILLATAPNLRQCALRFASHPIQKATPITFPRLRRLEIDNSAALVAFTAPVIEELLSQSSSGHNMLKLCRFIQRSSCLLKKLIMRDCGLSPDLIAVLRDLPLLTYLLIDFDEHDEVRGQNADENDYTLGQTALFTAMSASGSPRLCPRLVTLVYGVNLDLFPEDLFFAMARSRFHTSCLTHLRLYSARFFDIPLLRELRHDGFDAAVIPRAHTTQVYEQLFTFDGNVNCPYES
ncbi:hypothetical protein DFH06DRAFT_1054885 [Mycena polygramma]|nr:hypothetical protein DFH06DRAFT_1054885 [Mycena polygramma]